MHTTTLRKTAALRRTAGTAKRQIFCHSIYITEDNEYE